jgi:cysteinyl-tRNA synthetase
LQVEGEKMSKSLGNFITIRELLDEWPGPALRLTMLQTHYRQPINWTKKGIETSIAMLEDWFSVAGSGKEAAPAAEIVDALSDDLNTPKAIAELHALRNRAAHKDNGEAADALAASLAFLGFDRGALYAWLDKEKAAVMEDFSGLEPKIDALIAARIEARNAKDWSEADRIRDELVEMGVTLMDGKDPKTGGLVTTWEIRR